MSGGVKATIDAVSYHLPSAVVSNDDIGRECPDWDMARLEDKTGIVSRHVSAEGECSSDLAVGAASRLLSGVDMPASDIDLLLFCTQSPDYYLPTTACLLHDRLGLRHDAGALDFNLGCSGYVYGLFLAASAVRSGAAKSVLLLTGETYSKMVNPRDRTVRVLFGDAASATLVRADGTGAHIGEFELGTDGKGARNLIVPAGGFRIPKSALTEHEVTDASGCVRSDNDLYMNGQEVFSFTLIRVPRLVRRLLEKTNLTMDDVDWFIFHQANAFMNETLRARLKIPKEKAPLAMREIGNTVSNTIPITLCEVGNQFHERQKILMAGFGVGYSWGGCVLDWGDVSLFPYVSAS